MIFAKNLAAAESLFDALSTAVAAAGAFDFAAPEWLADPTNPTPAADQYALGAVGYFALTGRLPAPDGSLPDRLRGRTERPPPVQEANPDVPAELAAVIDLMLNPNPAGRFPGLGDVQALLAELVPDPPPPVEPEPIEPESVVPESAEPDPLFLSQLVPIRPGSSSTWPARDSGATKPPERDNSEASVAFDLPDPVIERPTASSRPAKPAEVPEPVASVETPRGAALKTRRSPTAEPAAEAAPPVKPAAPSPGSKLLGGFDANMALPPLPELPCAALPSIPTPVQWQTAETEPLPPAAPAEEPPAAEAAGWKRVRRKLLFWQAVQDQVQVSVFGPPTVAPGQTVRITVVLHPPGSADSVRTLARAFDRDAEPLGTGYLTRETARGDDLAVHLAVANAGVARSLISFPWQGRPHRLGFELHVPWECLAGPAPALVSVGRDDTRIGRAEFRLDVLPRKS